jgi:hypothetical protein
MTVRRTTTYRDAIATAMITAIGTSAQVQVRSGANSTSGGQGTLLAQLTGNASAWGATSSGVLTSNSITADSSADASGTAGHYQLNTSAGVFLESGLIGGGDGVTIDNATIVAAQLVQMSGNWVNTMPYA